MDEQPLLSGTVAVILLLIGLGWLRAEYLARKILERISTVARADRLIVRELELDDETTESVSESSSGDQQPVSSRPVRVRLWRIILLRYRLWRRNRKRRENDESRDVEGGEVHDEFDFYEAG